MKKYLRLSVIYPVLYLFGLVSPALASNDGTLDSEALGEGLYDFGIDFWYIFLIAGSILMFVLGVLVVLMIVRRDKEVAGSGSGSTMKETVDKKPANSPPAPVKAGTSPVSGQSATPPPANKTSPPTS